MSETSQAEFNQQVIETFRANGGEVGDLVGGNPVVLVHTIGARSGRKRVVPLVPYREGNELYLMASKGGSPEHPAWYHNLIAHPDVTIEEGTGTREVTVRPLPIDERNAIWPRIVTAFPQFGGYQDTATHRTIPVLRLDPR
jgi:deazaflavin-dependent oxidoreductase (nitroreductase family)